MRGGRFKAAVAHALRHPSPWPRDLRAVIEGETFDPSPWNVVKGPLRPRGEPAGVIVVGDEILAAWGDRDRADMVFSVTKSYVGLLAALALDEGLIGSLDEAVAARIDHPAFASAANRAVTWRQLLQHTSEWQGALWGIPDTVDRDRQLSPTDDPARFGRLTPHRPLGTYWDYNDIRVNALCLALTLLFRRALPDVLAERLPPFADRGCWSWHGYGEESTVEIEGHRIPVVVGGGHWGGGLAVPVALDAFLGRLVLGRGAVEGQRYLSAGALGQLFGPCRLQPVYGGLWWLNTERRLFPAASASAVFATGVGMNAVWVEPDHGLVAVGGWIDGPAVARFVELVADALE